MDWLMLAQEVYSFSDRRVWTSPYFMGSPSFFGMLILAGATVYIVMKVIQVSKNIPQVLKDAAISAILGLENPIKALGRELLQELIPKFTFPSSSPPPAAPPNLTALDAMIASALASYNAAKTAGDTTKEATEGARYNALVAARKAITG